MAYFLVGFGDVLLRQFVLGITFHLIEVGSFISRD